MKVGTGTVFLLYILPGSKHVSGCALLNVRADLRLGSMLVLRFNFGRSKANISSPVRAGQMVAAGGMHRPRQLEPSTKPIHIIDLAVKLANRVTALKSK